MTVFVMLYDHRRGMSVTVYESRDAALRGAAECVISTLAYIGDVAIVEAITTAYDEQKWAAVVELWEEYENDRALDIESIDIQEHTVLNADPTSWILT